ncbi:glycoside hydrolase family 97 protein [Mucilaginibacter sp. 14171R-50]|uniref:glycoside hydrolase family 97 protein n=1 Tax=Mucilaginibacter sp. 14171R-50 TaxID=2703789 RepID=UPI00138B6101|nr:glycoside hydrolase family 97 protein [Mucilaginibacter sp. 14171R-50]QHS56847.1 glycoside hydrolase family 97 protein [Mucilaginibacter sp. 14171R-50]
MKKPILAFLIFSAFISRAFAQHYTVTSPDNNLKMDLKVNDSITYAVTYKGTAAVLPSAISMKLDTRVLGMAAKVSGTKKAVVKKLIHPINGKQATIDDCYNELTLTFNGDYQLVLRAYNEGGAYRFVTNFANPVTVVNEQATFNISPTAAAIMAETDNYTAWELPYVQYKAISQIKDGKRAITPALFAYPNGVKVVVAEADLFDYPGMYIQKKNGSLQGQWAAYPGFAKMGSWGDFVSVVQTRMNFIAKTDGKRNYPWRVVIATDDDKTLLTNQLIYKLSRPSALHNTDWIKPGKAAWEWWHDALLPEAPIPSGMNHRSTELYNYYVDFAARNKLEYLLIDAGWSDNYDVRKPTGRSDIRAIIQHAKQKKVGVFVWCVASSILKDLDASLNYIKDIGAAGFKVDFFDRDDQQAIGWYELIAKKAAERHLMVDFHGCSKPTGLERTYPNIVNYEAVRGQECSKWDYTTNPEHHTLIPFIRMLAGPMDYTPGSMRNRSKSNFKPIAQGLPSTQGTRCHELAMFVIFDQPLGVLCDSPTEYEKYPDIMKYLSAVPTTFDETLVLDARVGEYIAIAKKKGDSWYLGAMTNWDARDINLDLSFLPANTNYIADIYTDAADADKNASKYEHKTITINRQNKLDLKLMQGGGAVVYLHTK